MHCSGLTRQLAVYLVLGTLCGCLLFTAALQGYSQSAAPPDKALRGKLICIDAGHGGSAKGAVGIRGLEEKVINFTRRIQCEAQDRSLRFNSP